MRNAALILLISLLLPAVSCKKTCHDESNPECENFNPCKGKAKTSAAFVIEELAPYPGYDNLWISYETDTILGFNGRFTAKEENASYEWQIGSQKYTLRSVALNFQGVPKEALIPVTLIVNEEPDRYCFPIDNGIDTLTRELYIAGRTRIEGRFQGHYTDTPGDTFTVEISMNKVDPNTGSYGMYIDNLVKGCASFIHDEVAGYRERVFRSDPNQCYALRGRAKRSGDTIEISFSYADPNDSDRRISKIFVGLKK
jgi:hypothetical protein